MPPGPSLCFYKHSCKADFGSPLQSGDRTFWPRENCGRSSETFLLAKTSTRRQQVYQILHCLFHFQDGHQESRIIHPSSYSQEVVGIHLHGLCLVFCPPSTKNDSMFEFVDYFLKMAILVAYKKNVTVTDTAKFFFECIWVHFGIPQTIISDQDSRLINTFWSSL
jgi:hypothetical protein